MKLWLYVGNMAVCENLTKEGLDMDLGMILFIIGFVLVIAGFVSNNEITTILGVEELTFLGLVFIVPGAFCIIYALIELQIIT